LGEGYLFRRSQWGVKSRRTKEGNIGFIIENSSINEIQLSTSDVYNEQEKLIDKAKTLDFHYK